MSAPLSRRRFVLTAIGTVAAGTRSSAARTITAADVIDRVRGQVGMPWRETSADGLKAGDPATTVTGIGVAVLPTIDVLRRAAAAGHNMIVALGPTFYAANDNPGARAQDAVYLAKRETIDRARLVIWRVSDHWSARRPSEASTALADLLGWRGSPVPGTEQVYRIADTTLGGLEEIVRRRLALRGGVRRVGRATLPVRTVFVSAGATDLPGTLANLGRADAILAGEPREWEAVPYVLDTAAASEPKGMIAIGRVVSEAPGVRACAAWLKTIVPDVPVTPFVLDDPYWNPLA
ncbi:MAG: Nif3-like dinuclear metal center hexameric protein [Acidobacteria bacterium]|nr:Nif3-like dinuclear metal center hexameric protein [Acidobacteriota bacterium]